MAGKVVTGAKWALLSGLFTKLSQPLFTIVLARILTPEDFGLMAMAMVVITFIGLFQNLGLGQALIQHRQLSNSHLSAVFLVSILVGTGWLVLLATGAPFVAEFYGKLQVTPVLQALGFLFPIAALGVVPAALLNRELAFRKLFWIELAPNLLPGATAIVLGMRGYGVWALVYGTLAGAVVRTLLLWTSVSWRPGRLSVRGEWAGMLGFGGWVSLESILGWAIAYADQTFASRFFSAVQVGYYRIGFALALLPASGISQMLAQVLFPAFSRLQDRPEEVRAGYERCLRLVAIVAVPLGGALVAFSDPLVPLLLGERWRGAVEVVQMLGAAGVLAALVSVGPPFYKAVGRADIMPRFLALRAAVSIPVYWFAAREGLTALVTAKLGLALCFAPINLTIAGRVFGVSWREMGASLAGPLFAAASGFAAAALLRGLLPDRGQVVPLACGIVAYGLAYAGVLLLTSPRSRSEAGWLMGALLGRANPQTTPPRQGPDV